MLAKGASMLVRLMQSARSSASADAAELTASSCAAASAAASCGVGSLPPVFACVGAFPTALMAVRNVPKLSSAACRPLCACSAMRPAEMRSLDSECSSDERLAFCSWRRSHSSWTC